MGKVVCKFGGSSLSCAKNFEIVKEIVKSQKNRKLVVVSAPGKMDKKGSKITDLLIDCFLRSSKNLDYALHFYQIKNRFENIIKDLGVDLDLKKDFQTLYTAIGKHRDYDFVVSRGEFLCAKIMAKYLNFDFLDAKDFIFFDKNDKIDIAKSKLEFSKLYDKNKYYVIPGFYGCKDGKIKTFLRGGSDITGAIVAQIAGCKKYENFTDVDGVFDVDPNKFSSAKMIKKLSFLQMKNLYNGGANVLHGDSLDYLEQDNIMLNLRNTFNYSNRGTLIAKNYSRSKNFCGIGIKDCYEFCFKIGKNDAKNIVNLIRNNLDIVQKIVFDKGFVKVFVVNQKAFEDILSKNSNNFSVEKRQLKIVNIVCNKQIVYEEQQKVLRALSKIFAKIEYCTLLHQFNTFQVATNLEDYLYVIDKIYRRLF